MNPPIQIADCCLCCETKVSVCRLCRGPFNKTEFAASWLGEQTGYSDELGAYCRSCSQKCRECEATSHSARLTIEAFAVWIWGKWSTV